MADEGNTLVPEAVTFTEPPPPPTTPTGRDVNGRFAKGHPGGPGGNRVTKYRQMLREHLAAAVTTEDVQAVIRKVRDAALSGDVAAAKLYLGWAIGSEKQEAKIEGGGELLVVERIVRTRVHQPAPDASQVR